MWLAFGAPLHYGSLLEISMAGPATRRTGARRRLKSGFLTGLPEQLRDLVAVLETDGSPEARDSVAHSLNRIADTADSLGLSGIGRESRRLAMRVPVTSRLTFGPLVKELRSGIGPDPFASIAVVGPHRLLSSIAAQDDGVCEALVLVESVEELRTAFTIDWPQAIVLPASEAPEVVALAGEYDCPILLYGPARDLASRRLGVRVGADGFLAEPLALSEVLHHVRFIASRPTEAPCVALIGPPEWTDVQGDRLRTRGMQVVAPGGYESIASTLHGVYPHAVVLGPGNEPRTREAIAVMRHHIGRGHVALLAYGDAAELGNTGVDDVLTPEDDLAMRLEVRLARFREHLSDRDELTQVANRPGALAGLQRMIARTWRGAGPMAVSLVFVEGLAEATVEHGREAANACRRHLAAALERGLRRVDLVGYLGEDLFVAGLVDCTTDAARRRLAEIRSTFEARVHADRRLRGVRLTIGIANTNRGTEGLMRRAAADLDAQRSGARV